MLMMGVPSSVCVGRCFGMVVWLEWGSKNKEPLTCYEIKGHEVEKIR
jgi:hypothetical protein